MMGCLSTLLLLLYPGAVLVEVANGFSVTHYYGQPRPLAMKSRARFVTCPHPPITPRFASSDDTSSPGDSNETDTPPDSDEEESPTSSAGADDEKDAPSSEADDSTLDADDDKPTFRERLKKLWWKNDDSDLTTRQRLAKMGLAAVMSYGWVSNVSYAICISLAWYGFSSKTGLSPLAPDQWKPFLAVYAGFFVFNNVIRPLRLGLSIAISTYFDQVVAWVQRKTKLNKSLSIGLVVFFFNIVGTISLVCLGISLASLASGVPVFVSS